MAQSVSKRALRLTVLAAAAAYTVSAQAAVVTTGDLGLSPATPALGPGSTELPGSTAWIGAALAGATGIGGLTVDGGSFLQLARLSFG